MLESSRSPACHRCTLSYKYLSKSDALTSPLAGIVCSPIPFCEHHHRKLIKPSKAQLQQLLAAWGFSVGSTEQKYLSATRRTPLVSAELFTAFQESLPSARNAVCSLRHNLIETLFLQYLTGFALPPRCSWSREECICSHFIPSPGMQSPRLMQSRETAFEGH